MSYPFPEHRIILNFDFCLQRYIHRCKRTAFKAMDLQEDLKYLNRFADFNDIEFYFNLLGTLVLQDPPRSHTDEDPCSLPSFLRL